MKNVGFVYHEDYLAHDTGLHPESKNRLIAIMDYLKKEGILDNVEQISPRLASEEEVSLVHPLPYISMVRDACKAGGGYLDPDTCISTLSYRAALRAVGGVLDGIDCLINGDLRRVFCAVRPPGHHAEVSRGMGFCLFNNIAIGARYALKNHNIERILILDWDCHHGNGTQHIFDTDPAVFYFSIHQYPHYPGTGSASESGTDEGAGTTLNIPLPAQSGDEAYIEAITQHLIPVMDTWKPRLIMLSAGFDAHEMDPLCGMNVTTEGFGQMTRLVCTMANEYSDGRIISLLEGGYHLDALSKSVAAHLIALE